MSLEQVKRILEFYANPNNHLEETVGGVRMVIKSPVAMEKGQRAQHALRLLHEMGVSDESAERDLKHRETERVVRVPLRG